MQIVFNHGTDKRTAAVKIDQFLDELTKREFPAGVKIMNSKKAWNGDRMDFMFQARKGFFGATVKGMISMHDSQVILQSDLPGFVTSFVSETKIRQVIVDQFNMLFRNN